MSRLKKTCAVVVGTTTILSATAGRASVAFVGLSKVPIPQASVDIDPRLTGYTCYDLLVSISAGDHWFAAGLQGQLGSGQYFYNAPQFNADTGLSPLAPYVPLLEFDTFVSRPTLIDPGDNAITGSFSGAPQATFPGSPNSSRLSTPNKIDVRWEDDNATFGILSGVQQLARLTVPNSVFGGSEGPNFINRGPGDGPLFTGILKATSDPNASNPFTFALDVPEPASVALTGVGLGAVALRRRKWDMCP